MMSIRLSTHCPLSDMLPSVHCNKCTNKSQSFEPNWGFTVASSVGRHVHRSLSAAQWWSRHPNPSASMSSWPATTTHYLPRHVTSSQFESETSFRTVFPLTNRVDFFAEMRSSTDDDRRWVHLNVFAVICFSPVTCVGLYAFQYKSFAGLSFEVTEQSAICWPVRYDAIRQKTFSVQSNADEYRQFYLWHGIENKTN